MSNFDPNEPAMSSPQTQAQSQYSPPQSQPQTLAQGYMPPAQSTYQQPSPERQVPVAQAAPKKSNRNIFLIIGGVLLLLVCGCFGSVFAFGGAIFGVTQPVADAGDRFMTALRDGDFNRAYDLCSPSLQSEVGSATNLESALQASRPTKWSINSRSINNNGGRVGGMLTLTDGREADFQLVLDNIGGEWKISGVDVDPR